MDRHRSAPSFVWSGRFEPTELLPFRDEAL
jgi:hypothetical protein